MQPHAPDAVIRQVVIGVSDLDAAVHRFRDGLGLQERFTDPAGWSVLVGDHIEVALAAGEQRADAGPVTLTMRSDDLNATVAHLLQHGFRRDGEPVQGGHELQQRCRDDDGNVVVVYRPDS